MFRLSSIVFLIMLLLTGCGKNEKPNIIDNPPSGNESIKLLADYKISVAEPSGLFYCNATGTLYMVSDHFSNIYEMTVKGEVTKTIPVAGSDLEGIVLTRGCDTAAVVEEGTNSVSRFLLNGTRISTSKYNTSSDPNHGLEGITIDNSNNYYIINQSSPCLLLKLDQTGKELWRKELTYSSDISDICFDSKTNALWLLSDNSKLLMKLSMDGNLLSSWSIPVNQAEGLALSADKIYICSDIDAKLYVFSHTF